MNNREGKVYTYAYITPKCKARLMIHMYIYIHPNKVRKISDNVYTCLKVNSVLSMFFFVGCLLFGVYN